MVTTTSASQHSNIGLLRTVGMEQVLDQWGVLIGGAQEQSEEVFEGAATSMLAAD